MQHRVDGEVVGWGVRALETRFAGKRCWLFVVALVAGLGLLVTGTPNRASAAFDRHVIQTGTNANGANAIQPVDFDGDNDVDVVTAASSTTDEFAWYEQDDADSTVFTRHVIDGGEDNPSSIRAVDFDGDDDMDVVATAQTSDVIAWYENDGSDVSFTQRIIDSGSTAAGAAAAQPVDFDGDGDVDVVAAVLIGDTFAWYDNDGTNTSFTRRVIDGGSSAEGATAIQPVDFDGDGDQDVVTAAFNGGFAWHENDGTNTSFTTHVIDSGSSTADASSIQSVLFDEILKGGASSGERDVVTAAESADVFARYENDGNDLSFTRRIIDEGSSAEGGNTIRVVDFDGDFDLDMVTSANDTFAWYENDGTNTVFTRRVIDSGPGALTAGAIHPVDFDGDGDQDVVTASFSDTFAWYENLAANAGSGGGGCLIERSGLSASTRENLRGLRDGVLSSSWGRYLTTRYYDWFGGTDG